MRSSTLRVCSRMSLPTSPVTGCRPVWPGHEDEVAKPRRRRQVRVRSRGTEVDDLFLGHDGLLSRLEFLCALPRGHGVAYSPAFSILAQVSRSVTVRLNTGRSAASPRRPRRSTLPLELKARARRGVRQARLELAAGQHLQRLRVQVGLPVVLVGVGVGRGEQVSYSRTSASTAWAADTQWIVPFTLRPSGASPPRVAGS